MGASWADLGASWKDLAAVLGLLGGVGGLLRRSGGLLERSWDLLGWSCRLWCCVLFFENNQMDFETDFEVQKGPHRGPKWSPKRFGNSASFEMKTTSIWGPDPFGGVLGRFGLVLVPIVGSKIIIMIICIVVVLQWFREHRHF